MAAAGVVASMTDTVDRGRTSTGVAVPAGTAVGLVVVALYPVAGVLVADWSTSEFLAGLSVGTVGSLAGMIALAVAFLGLPVAGLLRFDLVAPLGVLALALPGWGTLAAVQDLLSPQTVFGLALYVVVFSPFPILLYGVLDGGEYLLRTRSRGVSP